MGRTSSEVKNRYNKKTYSQWSADLRKEDFERIERIRGEMSRSAFLKMLVEKYCQDTDQQ